MTRSAGDTIPDEAIAVNMERPVEVRQESTHLCQGHIFEVCERVSEAQASLDSHLSGELSAADTIQKLNALLSEEGLGEAMRHIGYLPKRQMRQRV
jgi:hypothetical protein